MAARDEQASGSHYTDMPIQPWDVVDTAPIEQQIGFHRHTAISYLMRLGAKGSALEEAQKARHVLDKLIEVLSRQPS